MPASGPDQPRSPDLSVRQHERFECCLPGYAQVSPESARAVRIARAAAQMEGIPVTVVDCSAGGLGLRTETFLPRSCLLRVQAMIAPAPNSGASEGRLLEATVRVQRVAMIDRHPSYYIGASFGELTEAQQAMVNWVLEALRDGRGSSCARGLSQERAASEAVGGPAGKGTGGVRRAV